MLFTGPVSDNPEIKKQYNTETNAGEQGPVMQKTTIMQKEKKKKKLRAYQTATEITQSSH